MRECGWQTAVALAIAVAAFVQDITPASAQMGGDFYYLQEDKPRRKRRPPAQPPTDPNAATTPSAPGSPATPGSTPPGATAAPGTPGAPTQPGSAQKATPSSAPADATRTAPVPPVAQPAASDARPATAKHMRVNDPIDPRVAEIVDILTGPDDAKFDALLNPPPRPPRASAPGEKPVGQPIETTAPAETGAVAPPLGPDVETTLPEAPPAPPSVAETAATESAQKTERAGIGYIAPVRGELNETLAHEDRAKELLEAGRLQEAESEAKRLLDLFTKDTPPTTNPAIDTISLLAAIDEAAGRLDQAQERYRRALGLGLMQNRFYERDEPVSLDQNEAILLGRLANIAATRHDAAGAERQFERALRISRRYSHPATVDILSDYARYEANGGQLEKAAAHYQESLTLAEKLEAWLPPSTTVYALNSLARVKHAQGDVDGALAAFRQAKNVPQFAALASPGSRDAYAYDDFIAIAYERATRVEGERETLSAEAFDAAQRTKFGEAAAALAQMAARQAQKKGPLADLARQYQDQLQKRRGNERQLATLLRTEAPRKDTVAGLRSSLSDANLAVADLERLFATDFPSYAALANPAPATIAETQALLAPNEAMVVFDLAGENSFGWVLSRNSSMWRALALSERSIEEDVEALRCGLDYAAWREEGEKRCQSLLATRLTYADLTTTDARRRKPLPFDAARASRLYEAILAPFADVIAGKQLLVVPDGTLATLPLSVLVTAKPALAVPASSEGYRDVAWLGARSPMTVLPSVSSLRALRRTLVPAPAPETYLGIGEPTLTGSPRCPKVAVPASCPGPAAQPPIDPATAFSRVAAKAVSTFASFFRSGRADVEAVRALCPLPDTAYELLCVAQSLSAPSGHVLVGASATEAAVKRLPLDRYRILHFATHGLLAGETARLAGTGAEPALVLTPPAAASAEDDGLLTASEISELKLNADWVVMSACNTAAAGGESEEALSGLARAFFYAGARSLLVSHWEVNSQAAVKLTTTAFADLQKNPAHGRAEAMRRSMATLIEKGADYETHPAYWAPFVLVGEGNAR